jgi:hypothetical protein
MFYCVYFDYTVEKLLGRGGYDCKGRYFTELSTETFVLMCDFLMHSFEPPNCLELQHT